MTENITISEAQESDLPPMVSVAVDSMEADILTSFLYGHRRAEAARKHTESLTGSLGKRFTHPTNRCHITKATDTQTGELVGWSLVRWEDGTPLADSGGSSDQRDFPTVYMTEVKKRWNRLTAGKPHVGALHVNPDRQRQGIGRQLIGYIYSKYDLDNERVFLFTRATSEGFYEKLGWVTADATEVDLSEWEGKGKGYGMHRAPQMVRGPKSL
ncbi:MAG: hypothetical protein Q9227_007451 [Pyrenula ochraceoflavens]